MDDKVNLITPQKEEYPDMVTDLLTTRGWHEESEADEQAVVVEFINLMITYGRKKN